MLISISFTSVLGSNTKLLEKKESPLYAIRTSTKTGKNDVKMSAQYVSEKTKLLIPRLQNTDKLKYLKTHWTTADCVSKDVWCVTTAHKTCLWGIIVLLIFIICSEIINIIEGFLERMAYYLTLANSGSCKMDYLYDLTDKERYTLSQKIENDSYIQKLVVENPELLPKIMALII